MVYTHMNTRYNNSIIWLLSILCYTTKRGEQNERSIIQVLHG